jgi:uncharacterized membrane protein
VIQDVLRACLALLLASSGVLHFLRPRWFLRIMPPSLPWPLLLVHVSGAFELLGAIGLLQPDPRLRSLAGFCVVALLVAIFPANVYQALAGIPFGRKPAHPAVLWGRLPLQAVLIWIAWSTTRSADRP